MHFHWGGGGGGCRTSPPPMGSSLPGLPTQDPLLAPPLTLAQIFWHTCLQSHLQTSPPTPQKSYMKFQNFTTFFEFLYHPLCHSEVGRGDHRLFFIGILIIKWHTGVSKISKSYDNFWIFVPPIMSKCGREGGSPLFGILIIKWQNFKILVQFFNFFTPHSWKDDKTWQGEGGGWVQSWRMTTTAILEQK